MGGTAAEPTTAVVMRVAAVRQETRMVFMGIDGNDCLFRGHFALCPPPKEELEKRYSWNPSQFMRWVLRGNEPEEARDTGGREHRGRITAQGRPAGVRATRSERGSGLEMKAGVCPGQDNLGAGVCNLEARRRG